MIVAAFAAISISSVCSPVHHQLRIASGSARVRRMFARVVGEAV
jgi:hypothetical protein